MIRSFVAVSIPAEVLERVESVIVQLRRLDLDARFTKVQAIHLTLKFLGDIHEEMVPSLSASLQEGVRGLCSFEVTLGGLGVFPNAGKPRVVWMGIKRNESLTALHGKVEAILEALGFEADGRPFVPHLTLARLKSRQNRLPLIDYLENQGRSFSAGTFKVEKVRLFQSILRPDGAQYRCLASVPLDVT